MGTSLTTDRLPVGGSSRPPHQHSVQVKHRDERPCLFMSKRILSPGRTFLHVSKHAGRSSQYGHAVPGTQANQKTTFNHAKETSSLNSKVLLAKRRRRKLRIVDFGAKMFLLRSWSERPLSGEDTLGRRDADPPPGGHNTHTDPPSLQVDTIHTLTRHRSNTITQSQTAIKRPMNVVQWASRYREHIYIQRTGNGPVPS